MESGSPPSLDQAEASSVGAVLAKLRRRAGLTGHQLGARAGMSQAKVSRIETGAVAADPKDIRALASALRVSADEERQLLTQADRSQNRMMDWRLTNLDIADRQREVEKIETETTQFRVFQPSVIVGLLQTSEYARAILTRFQMALVANDSSEPTGEIAEAVAARLKRQQILSDPQRLFYLLMSEVVLSNQVCDAPDMLTQIKRLRKVGKQKNVHLRIIPADARWGIPPYHGFELLDDKYVMVDLFNTTMTSEGRADANHYRRVFDNLAQRSTEDTDQILARYYRHYADLINPDELDESP